MAYTALNTISDSDNGLWEHWQYIETMASSNTVTTVWTGWNSTAVNSITSSTLTTTCNDTWIVWLSGTATALNTVRAVRRELTPEELAIQEAVREEGRRARLEQQRKEKEATERAEGLLLAVLNKEQTQQYKKEKAFYVIDGDRRYRIRTGRYGNVDVIGRDGVISHSLCAHPHELLPHADTMLAQLLMLTTEPERFERIANRTPRPVEVTQLLPALN